MKWIEWFNSWIICPPFRISQPSTSSRIGTVLRITHCLSAWYEKKVPFPWPLVRIPRKSAKRDYFNSRMSKSRFPARPTLVPYPMDDSMYIETVNVTASQGCNALLLHQKSLDRQNSPTSDVVVCFALFQPSILLVNVNIGRPKCGLWVPGLRHGYDIIWWTRARFAVPLCGKESCYVGRNGWIV